MAPVRCADCVSVGEIHLTDYEWDEARGSFAGYCQKHRLFPSELDLINLVYFQYSLKTTDNCVHACQFRVKEKYPDELYIEECCTYMDSNGWILLEIFSQDGKHSATFFNVRSKQLVIVHRGTKFKNPAAVWADLKLTLSEIGSYGYTAYTYTKRVVAKYGAAAASITVTGHSLGGWSAQVAAFFCKFYTIKRLLDSAVLERSVVNEDNVKKVGNVSLEGLRPFNVIKSLHLHCVSFDGPGCKEAIGKLFNEIEYNESLRFAILDSLDITVYLSLPNFTNIVNEQVGAVFHMKNARPNQDTLTQREQRRHSRINDILTRLGGSLAATRLGRWVKRFVLSHRSGNILEFWRKYEQNEAHLLRVFEWATAEGFLGYVKNIVRREVKMSEEPFHQFRAAIFGQNERETLLSLAVFKRFYEELPDWITLHSESTSVSRLIKGPFTLYITPDPAQCTGFQLLQIHRIPSSIGMNPRAVELCRDFVIQNTKAHLCQAEALELSSELPNYTEAVYVLHTNVYVKSLVSFEGPDSNRLDFDQIRANLASVESSILIIQTPVGETHLTVSQMHQMLTSVNAVDEPGLFTHLNLKQYCVLSVSILHKLDFLYDLSRLCHANPNNLTNTRFLPTLEYILIEFPNVDSGSEDLNVLRSWVQRLYLREYQRTKIVIVHSVADLQLPMTKLNFLKIEIDDKSLDRVRASIDVVRLVQNSNMQFKFQGSMANFLGVICSDVNFYQSDSISSFKAKLYRLSRKETLGALLPQPSPFEAKFQQSRTFKNLAISEYGSDDLIIISCPIEIGTGMSLISDFINRHHPKGTTDRVLCQNIAKFNQETHRFVLMERISEMKDIQKHFSGLSGHILELRGAKFEKQELIWQYSFGCPDALALKFDPLSNGTSMEALLDIPSPVVAILGDSGSGVTTAMHALATEYQLGFRQRRIRRREALTQQIVNSLKGLAVSDTKAQPEEVYREPWTIFVDLDRVGSTFSTLTGKPISFESAVHVLASIEGGGESDSAEIIAFFLEHLLKEANQVTIFVEGFDKVSEDLTALVFDCLEVIVSTSGAKVFIACERTLVSEVNDRFGVPCFQLDNLSQNKMSNFLVQYWTNNEEFVHNPMVNESWVCYYATMLLHKFLNNLKNSAQTHTYDGISMPDLRMLAECTMRDFFKFYESCTQLNNSEKQSVLREKVSSIISNYLPDYKNVAQVYNTFIDTKIREAAEAKYGIELDTLHIVLKYNDEFRMSHRVAGFQKIFSSALRAQITGDSKPLSQSQVETLYTALLVISYSPNLNLEQSDATKFAHNGMAEFFAAEFIYHELIKLQQTGEEPSAGLRDFLESYLLLPKYEKVYNFLNLLIFNSEHTPSIMEKCFDLDNNLTEVEKYFAERRVEVDCLGRTPLHYIIMYSKFSKRTCPTCQKIKTNGFLMQAEYLYHMKDLFGATPFAYISSNPDLSSRVLHTKEFSLAGIFLNLYLKPFRDVRPLYLKNSLLEIFQKAPPTLYYIEMIDRLEQNPKTHELNCSCDLSAVQILKWLMGLNSNLVDYSLALNRNILDSVTDLIVDTGAFHDFLIRPALGRCGHSRLNVVCELWLSHKRRLDTFEPSVRIFEKQLTELLLVDRYELYKDSITQLKIENETQLLNLIFKTTSNQVQCRTQIYEVWKETNFISVRRALGTQDWDSELFDAFRTVMSLCTENTERNVSMVREVILPWYERISIPGGSFLTARRLLYILPVVMHLLYEKEDREAFVEAHESHIANALKFRFAFKSQTRKRVIELAIESLRQTEKGIKLLETSQVES